MNSTHEALIALAESTAEAVAGVLRMFAPEGVDVGQPSVVADGGDPLEHLPVPAVATNISYVDGVTGGNLFVMGVDGARRLAAAMMGAAEPENESGEGDLTELELSAVSEAMNQMMAAAAGATSAVIGKEVEISPPEIKVFPTLDAARDSYQPAPHTTTTSFVVLGSTCRLVQLVPTAFTVRMTQALEERGAEIATTASDVELASAGSLDDALRDVQVRVCAELGRARLPVRDVVELPAGAVVELDRYVDDAIDIYVNGMRFATGKLIVADDTEWAVRIEAVAGVSAGNSANETKGDA